jgi:hypothetical protein
MRTQLGTVQNIDELLVGGRERIGARGVTGNGWSTRVVADRRSTDQTNRPRVYSWLLVSSVRQPDIDPMTAPANTSPYARAVGFARLRL